MIIDVIILGEGDDVLDAGGIDVVEGPGGSMGPPGPPGESFYFTQPSASAEWIVNHNLGFRPAAAVFNVGGREVEAEIVHVSTNQLRVYFTAPMTGSVHCV